VYLCEKDLECLALALKMEKNSFLSVYCRWVTDWKGDEVLSLKEKSNNDCILWDEGCTVYSVRPLQCITFPFWESVVSTVESWEIASYDCPGMNFGKLHSGEVIKEAVDLRTAHPIITRTRASREQGREK
jgi:hypothetical protein